MSKHNDSLFRQVVTGGLRRTHSQGVARGAYAMCKTILGLAEAEGKTAEERLASITMFCRICSDPDQAEKILNPAPEDTDNEV